MTAYPLPRFCMTSSTVTNSATNAFRCFRIDTFDECFGESPFFPEEDAYFLHIQFFVKSLASRREEAPRALLLNFEFCLRKWVPHAPHFALLIFSFESCLKINLGKWDFSTFVHFEWDGQTVFGQKQPQSYFNRFDCPLKIQ